MPNLKSVREPLKRGYEWRFCVNCGKQEQVKRWSEVEQSNLCDECREKKMKYRHYPPTALVRP